MTQIPDLYGPPVPELYGPPSSVPQQNVQNPAQFPTTGDPFMDMLDSNPLLENVLAKALEDAQEPDYDYRGILGGLLGGAFNLVGSLWGNDELGGQLFGRRTDQGELAKLAEVLTAATGQQEQLALERQRLALDKKLGQEQLKLYKQEVQAQTDRLRMSQEFAAKQAKEQFKQQKWFKEFDRDTQTLMSELAAGNQLNLTKAQAEHAMEQLVYDSRFRTKLAELGHEHRLEEAITQSGLNIDELKARFESEREILLYDWRWKVAEAALDRQMQEKLQGQTFKHQLDMLVKQLEHEGKLKDREFKLLENDQELRKFLSIMGIGSEMAIAHARTQAERYRTEAQERIGLAEVEGRKEAAQAATEADVAEAQAEAAVEIEKIKDEQAKEAGTYRGYLNEVFRLAEEADERYDVIYDENIGLERAMRDVSGGDADIQRILGNRSESQRKADEAWISNMSRQEWDNYDSPDQLVDAISKKIREKFRKANSTLQSVDPSGELESLSDKEAENLRKVKADIGAAMTTRMEQLEETIAFQGRKVYLEEQYKNNLRNLVAIQATRPLMRPRSSEDKLISQQMEALSRGLTETGNFKKFVPQVSHLLQTLQGNIIGHDTERGRELINALINAPNMDNEFTQNLRWQ